MTLKYHMLKKLQQRLKSTHKITFTDLQAIVAQNRIGGGDMEEKLRQPIIDQVIVANKLFLFR